MRTFYKHLNSYYIEEDSVEQTRAKDTIQRTHF